MPPSSRFSDALLVSPVGVALLGILEGEVRRDVEHWRVPTDCDLGAVAAAADAVSTRSLGSFLAVAVDVGVVVVGPWMSGAADELAAAYRHAEQRAPIAEAIDDRFGVDLHATLEVGAQQWWHSARDDLYFFQRRFSDFHRVYEAGQFTEAGLWTVSDPPSEVHAAVISAWELEPGPVSRWHMPVRSEARVLEIHRPQDWAQLVQAHPLAGRTYSGWELPGPNQSPTRLRKLLATPGQRAACTSIRQQLAPDWAAVAADYDGVHLSWAGFLSSEGYVSDLDSSDRTMLRYWFSERTLWLNDVFDDPLPAGPPDVVTDGTSITVCDVRTDRHRRRRDQVILSAQFGRSFESFDAPPAV